MCLCAVVVPGRRGVLGLRAHTLTVVLAWLAHACLDSIGHLCIRHQLKKHGGPILEQSFFRNTLGTEFLITLELVKFCTMRKKVFRLENFYKSGPKRNLF